MRGKRGGGEKKKIVSNQAVLKTQIGASSRTILPLDIASWGRKREKKGEEKREARRLTNLRFKELFHWRRRGEKGKEKFF